MSTKFRIRFSDALAAQIEEIGEAWNLTLARLVRIAVKDLVEHQERLPELVTAHTPFILDAQRSPAQIGAWERDRHRFEGVDLEELVTSMHTPGAGA
jgi:hypothetical protein